MKEHLARMDRPDGVVFIGKAQEKTPVFRNEKRHNPQTGASYPWIVRSSAMVNHCYCYCLERDFGPFFLKFCSLSPVQRHAVLERARVRQMPTLPTGHRVQGARQRLSFPATAGTACRRPSAINWARGRSTPCCGARRPNFRILQPRGSAGRYRHDLSILQAEFSLTQILDRRLSGRIFFEEIIRENLDLGRHVRLIFDRRIPRCTSTTRVAAATIFPSRARRAGSGCSHRNHQQHQ